MNIVNQDKQIIEEYGSPERAYQTLNLAAKLKTFAEDFIVAENIAVDFSGEGEHCWLYIKKRGSNTDWIAQRLANFCGVKKMAVSYAGLKDRHAVTSQWFSVQMPGMPTPDWHEFEAAFNDHAKTNNQAAPDLQENIQVLQSHRHNKKLQRGALKSNAFKITLRELSRTDDDTFALLQQRCDEISCKGVPNYFGEQRFGRYYNNLAQAKKMFQQPRARLSRHKRSMYLSAARSLLFNCILSERVKQQLWDRRLPGDVFMLDGKSACFRDETDERTNDIDTRLAQNEIHPTAVLWGRGDTMVTVEAAALESRTIDQHPVYRDGLVKAGLEAQRRACRLIPGQLACAREGDNFVIEFSLPAGSYATVVLDEIFSDITAV